MATCAALLSQVLTQEGFGLRPKKWTPTFEVLRSQMEVLNATENEAAVHG
jgi:hypothetical protein